MIKQKCLNEVDSHISTMVLPLSVVVTFSILCSISALPTQRIDSLGAVVVLSVVHLNVTSFTRAGSVAKLETTF